MDDSKGREGRGARAGGGGWKAPRKVSPRSLENAALHHLRRYAATVSGLRRVLLRRVDRSVRHHGGERAEAAGWVEALLERLVRGGLLDDGAYAHTKAHALRGSGRSARAITQRLRLKGVAPELAAQKLALASAEVSEEEAARIWARKKRLGPYGPGDAAARRERRERDLAALARAGFGFALARRIVDGAAG